MNVVPEVVGKVGWGESGRGSTALSTGSAVG